METQAQNSVGNMDRLFKSYYVVWKQAEGEDIFQGDVWFKSYYVVWKQLRFRRPNKRCLFKSYYVVWKPNPYIAGGLAGIMFKSYYVVWKLFLREKSTKAHRCLNRTMQYGNFWLPRGVTFSILCLNRTMQYGNHASQQKTRK